MKPVRAIGLFVVVLIMILTACQSNQTKSKPESNSPKSSVEKKSQGQSAKSSSENNSTKQPVYPLTGLPANGPVNNRVVGVMVNNYYLARPQSGLEKADIVYEVLAEGRITRFLALFQSQKPETIGPVRSARPYFIKLNQGYGALYVAFGWSPDAKKILQSGGIDYIQGLYHDGTWFKRVTWRKAPHNAYITYKNIEKGAKESGYSMAQTVKPLPFLTQSQVTGLSGEPVKKVTITYSSDNVVSYVYNPDKKLFYRHINGQQAEDLDTKTPLTAANVFIVSAKHQFLDSYGRRIIDLDSGGPAYLLQHGVVQKVEWKNIDGRILPYKNGKALGFAPGQTWINVVESSPGLDKEVILQKGS